jgi:serine/threonine-protein kinase
MKMKFMALCLMAGMFALPSCKKDKETTPTPTPVTPATVSAISPSAGAKNTLVSISGINFGNSMAVLKVFFNNVQGTIQSANDTLITALVPVNAGTGMVKVEKNGTLVNGPAFEYYVTGRVFTYAGTSQGFAEGNAGSAQFNTPSGVVRDAAGNLFVCDRDNHRIRKITAAGVVSTFAGSSTAGFNDGTGSAASFNQPYSIAIDASGNLFVGDRMNHAVRKITPAGVVTTLAGNGVPGDVDATGAAARFHEPLGITVDPSGLIYVADYINQKIKKITQAGVVTTFQSKLAFGLTSDAAGNIYATGYSNHDVFKYSPSGSLTTVAGTVNQGGNADGTGAAARFYFPSGIVVDNSGTCYVTDAFNHRIRKITAAGVVTTLAGNDPGLTDGIGSGASFYTPLALCADFSKYTLYVADFANHRIRKVIVD